MAGSTLYLLPVWLGDEGGIELMPPANIAMATRVKNFFCEHEKTARHMLRRISTSKAASGSGTPGAMLGRDQAPHRRSGVRSPVAA